MVIQDCPVDKGSWPLKLFIHRSLVRVELDAQKTPDPRLTFDVHETARIAARVLMDAVPSVDVLQAADCTGP